MSLVESFSKPTTSKCAVGRILIELTSKPDDKEALIHALADRRWSNPAIIDALSVEGLSLSIYQSKTHRAHRCACFRDLPRKANNEPS